MSESHRFAVGIEGDQCLNLMILVLDPAPDAIPHLFGLFDLVESGVTRIKPAPSPPIQGDGCDDLDLLHGLSGENIKRT